MTHGLQWGDKKHNKKVVCQINLLIPQSHFVYTCRDLHKIPHGDERMVDKIKFDSKLKSSAEGMETVDILHSTIEDPQLPLRLYDSHSDLLVGISQCVPNIEHMQANLFKHLSSIDDEEEQNGNRDSNGVRVDFGLMGYHEQPRCNLKSYHSMNDALQADISKLLQYCNEKLNYCGDTERTKIGKTLFHDAGWTGDFPGWEYINISLRSVEDDLYKHFDSLNDRRDGYNHAAVYSYLHSHCNKTYRVVIVMTFRNAMGCYMDRQRGD